MKRVYIVSFLVALLLLDIKMLPAQQFEAGWDSLSARKTPNWFNEAKFGIFIHWGVYSVPAYRPDYKGSWDNIYAEWYAPDVMYKPWRNDSFHIKTYGKSFEYRDFASGFKAELWEPEEWAGLFEKAGAKYVVLTAKHHDGYALWPASSRYSQGWNTMQTGPKRDITGELAEAVRAKGLKFGVYYSWLEWETTGTTWPHDPKFAEERTGYYVPKEIWQKYHIPEQDYVNHLHAHVKELVRDYSPALIFFDGAWDNPDTYWKSKELLAWIYNHSPDSGIMVNDRLGNNTTGRYGDYFATEYGKGDTGQGNKPWEETQGLGYSFGYNRAENIEQYKTVDELITLLIKTISAGGNLLLNVGPSADGKIPVIMQERLLQMGQWLEVNAEAVYGSKPLTESLTCTNLDDIHFTHNNGNLYIFLDKWPQNNVINIEGFETELKKPSKVELLGYGQVQSVVVANKLVINLPDLEPDDYQHAYVFKLLNY